MNMYLTRHQTSSDVRWGLNGFFLPPSIKLSMLLELSLQSLVETLPNIASKEQVDGTLLPPIESTHEVWGCGVTYLRSREARREEARFGDIYTLVYEAERPEVFFKTQGWRVVGHEMAIRIRKDSHWMVPEPELTLVINRYEEIVGYCAGNDVSSRDIEGENPLYLPQAKTFNGSCALGPGIRLATPEELTDLSIRLDILRQGEAIYSGETRSSNMKRKLDELVAYLFQELTFPHGVFLMTGTGIVPPDEVSLMQGDRSIIKIGDLTLENGVQ